MAQLLASLNRSIKCGDIRPKQELKRCSGCLSAYYCSRKCQANDWRRGGHRQTCGPREYSPTSTKDRSFFLALVLHTHRTQQEKITQKHRLFKQKYPEEIPFIMLDFTTGTCEIHVRSSGDVPSEYVVDMERAASSGGELQLYLMKVLDGTLMESGKRQMTLIWSFPLRIGNHSAPV
ncbi:MYND-type domain-containing protein [Mycena sanguinolenta]|uniref:MYND-type domain-containing protein n=1 Tax=Mycena sanguinolenta TaxID=230812 RepID=A0A8H7D2K8_9AGAR|nr:MYND-type domain-containing protein [Mycena sanguinolenta]